jgi:hypothetical protein
MRHEPKKFLHLFTYLASFLHSHLASFLPSFLPSPFPSFTPSFLRPYLPSPPLLFNGVLLLPSSLFRTGAAQTHAEVVVLRKDSVGTKAVKKHAYLKSCFLCAV